MPNETVLFGAFWLVATVAFVIGFMAGAWPEKEEADDPV